MLAAGEKQGAWPTARTPSLDLTFSRTLARSCSPGLQPCSAPFIRRHPTESTSSQLASRPGRACGNGYFPASITLAGWSSSEEVAREGPIPP